MTDFLRSRNGIIVASSAIVALLVGVALFIFQPWSSDSDNKDKDGTAEVVPEGYTTETTVPTIDPSQAQPAQPKPEVAPPLIFAEGECKVALDNLRALFAAHPSGLALDEAGMTQLNEALPALSADCDATTASNFQTQELGPWLNYSVE